MFHKISEIVSRIWSDKPVRNAFLLMAVTAFGAGLVSGVGGSYYSQTSRQASPTASAPIKHPAVTFIHVTITHSTESVPVTTATTATVEPPAITIQPLPPVKPVSSTDSQTSSSAKTVVDVDDNNWAEEVLLAKGTVIVFVGKLNSAVPSLRALEQSFNWVTRTWTSPKVKFARADQGSLGTSGVTYNHKTIRRGSRAQVLCLRDGKVIATINLKKPLTPNALQALIESSLHKSQKSSSVKHPKKKRSKHARRRNFNTYSWCQNCCCCARPR